MSGDLDAALRLIQVAREDELELACAQKVMKFVILHVEKIVHQREPELIDQFGVFELGSLVEPPLRYRSKSDDEGDLQVESQIH